MSWWRRIGNVFRSEALSREIDEESCLRGSFRQL